MFKDVPHPDPGDDSVRFLLEQMDKFGIERGMLGIGLDPERAADSQRALRDYPDRFFGSFEVNPNRGMDGVRDLVRAVEELGVKAATAFPCGMNPQVPINDAKFFPLYAKCIELDIPICVCAGVPGPRVPFAPQYVGLIDEVCWYFPELKFVTRHGCEPWADLAAKLLLKWPNLYYSTSAFAPRYYPKAIVDFANTRGADKVMYAGYYPMGLSLDRIFKELPDVPFRDHVWPRFLRENAERVFQLS
jgi:predicted TIM-barrel fold metal-dependent hydrolase